MNRCQVQSLHLCARALTRFAKAGHGRTGLPAAAAHGHAARRGLHTRSVVLEDKTERKLKELKKSLLSDYVGVELSERQQVEWANIEEAVHALDETGKGDHYIGEDNVWVAGGDEWPGFALHKEDTTTLERIDFTHLTSAHIQAHAQQLRAGFVPAPGKGPVDILRFGTRQYVNLDMSTNKAAKQGLQEAKVTLKFYLDDLQLPKNVRENMIELVSPRYNEETDEVQLTSERFPSSKMNKEYLKTLLTRLVKEAKALEAA